MKTTLYFGAPRPVKLNLLGASGACTCFDSVDDAERWLRGQPAQTPLLPAPKATRATNKEPNKEPAVQHMRRVCTNCTTREASPGETFCEHCLTEIGAEPLTEAERTMGLKCDNAGKGITGCVYYAMQGQRLCAWCRDNGHKWINRRIRSVPAATRTCNMTENCPGEMTAQIRKEARSIEDSVLVPVLWWHCINCHKEQMAAHTGAVPDPRIDPVLAEQAETERLEKVLKEYRSEGHRSEGRAMAEHINDVMAEG